jgi:hypothetical protein
VERLIERIYDDIEDKKVEAAQKRITKLQKIIGSEQEDVVQATILVDRLRKKDAANNEK